MSSQVSHNAPYSQSEIPVVLTVAGSDSGGGAGIQADIKAISATGSYACSVITALTAQNTQGVSGVMAVPGDFIKQQFAAIFSDIKVSAVKIGMLGDVATIRTVADAIRTYKPEYVVLDPVMVATSGDLLLAEDAIDTLIDELLPLADVITPNLPEALALLQARQSAPVTATDDASIEQYCQQLLAYNCKSVLIKGGHQDSSSSTDFWLSQSLLQDNQPCEQYTATRINTQNTHGTGCTLSASIASFLARDLDMPEAIGAAKQYIHNAISRADDLSVGEGHGPVHHFYQLHQAKSS